MAQRATPNAPVRGKNSYQGVDTRQDFSLNSKFLGYRNREDKTLLPVGWMIDGSQNVLIDISGRLKSRQGMVLDGQASTSLDTSVKGSYDWLEPQNNPIYLRYNSGNLQFRYDNGTSIVWTTIKSGLDSTKKIRFCNFADTTEVLNVLLFVNASQFVYEWNGATTTFASATTNSITKQGTDTWANAGFYSNGNKKIMLDGVEYTYTGGETTTTLTGVTPDPTGGTPTVGDLVYQSVISTATSAITSFPANYDIYGISNKDNQIYYGSEKDNKVVMSNVSNYKSVAYSSPRVPGEGGSNTLSSSWRAFVVQESDMYVSAGKSQWYKSSTFLASDNVHESWVLKPLKTTKRIGALSQETVSSDRNSVVFISNEPRFLTLGLTLDIFGFPQNTEYSYPIVNELNNIDITDACVFYDRSYVYMSFPKSGKWYILNQTNPDSMFWEAPQTGNISSFSNIDGSVYGHDYYTAQTFKLFSGYTDNGNPILSRACFPFLDYNNKGLSKYFNEFWVEGYITKGTELTLKWLYDLDGCQTYVKKTISGTSKNVCSLKDDGILGGKPLGVAPLGSNTITTITDPLPPYFSLIKVGVRKDFYKLGVVFESYKEDAHWELLTFGPLVQNTFFGNNNLKED
jgi:hypothetical protein